MQFSKEVIVLSHMSKIKFKKSKVTLNWTDDDSSILECAEANALDLDYGCRMGNCTACQQKIISGAVKYPNGHTGEPDAGHVLLCCCIPKDEGDLIIDA